MMSHHPTWLFSGQQPFLTFVWRQLTSGTSVSVLASRLITTNEGTYFGRGWRCYTRGKAWSLHAGHGVPDTVWLGTGEFAFALAPALLLRPKIA